MNDAEADAGVEEAAKEARRARALSIFWWVQVPLVGGVYWIVSDEPLIERAMLIYLALVSIIANAATYSAKRTAAEGKKAGYENP